MKTNLVKLGPGGCWNRAVNKKNGYGSILGKPAHRASYRMFNGEIPDDMVIMHDCDNKRCVNPAHLKLGSRGENVREANSRGLVGRPSRTSTRINTRLSRWFSRTGISQAALARRLNINQMTVWWWLRSKAPGVRPIILDRIRKDFPDCPLVKGGR